MKLITFSAHTKKKDLHNYVYVCVSVHTGTQVSPKRKLLSLQSQTTEVTMPRTTPVWPPLCGSGPRTAGKSLSRTAYNFC